MDESGGHERTQELGQQPGQTGRRRSLDGLFAAVRGLGIERNTDDRWVGGVCSGIANRFGVDPLLIRGITIVLAFVGGLGLLAYLVAWALLPAGDGHILAEDAFRGDGHGIALLVIIGIVLIGHIADRSWLWLLLVPLGLVIWWAVQSARVGKTPEQMSEEAGRFANRVAATFSAPPAEAGTTPHGMGPGRTGSVVAAERVVHRPRTRGGFLGLLLTAGLAAVGYGIGSWYAGSSGFSGTRQVLAAGFALAGAGLALFLLGLSGRRAGFTTFLVTLAALGTVAATAVTPLPPGGIGEQEWLAVSQPAGGYSLTAGDAKLQLAGVPSGGAVHVNMGMGQLRVTVPKDSTATFTTYVRAGQVVVTRADGTKSKLGGMDAGNPQTVTAGTGPNTVNVDVRMVAGEILITEEH